ncbi:MAG: hypothetical protein WCF10_20185 [Polyangiales bacterium]
MKYLALILTFSLAAPALADAQETKSSSVEYSAPKQDECGKVSTAGLATSVAVSAFGVGAGMGLMVAGLGDPSSSVPSYAKSTPGLIGGGAALMALSVGGLIASSIYLHRKREKKAAYKRGQCEAPVAIVPGVHF